MAQPTPEHRETIEQVLRLVTDLSPEEQEQLIEQMKLQWLRRAIDQAEESLAQGKIRPAEEVFAKLEEKYRRKAEK